MKVAGKIVIELSALEVERLLAVLMDEDREEAFRFLKECLEWKVKDKIRPHCVPVFELSYSSRQKGQFQEKDYHVRDIIFSG